jgi:hypothetical protein
MKKFLIVILTIIFAVSFAVSAFAEGTASPGAAHDSGLQVNSVEEQKAADAGTGPSRTYGTSFSNILQIPALAFSPVDVGCEKIEDLFGYISIAGCTGFDTRLGAAVNLPNGAQIRWLDLYYDDSSASDINVDLWEFTGTTSPSISNIGNVTSSGTPGPGYSATFLSPSFVTVDNGNQYVLYVFLANNDSTLKFKSVDIWYRLQMSPGPGTATFNDVGTGHIFFNEIEALFDTGIISGCGGGNYCPGSPVTRGQMAAFLARILGLYWPI